MKLRGKIMHQRVPADKPKQAPSYQWVVLENAGSDKERILSEHRTVEAAYRAKVNGGEQQDVVFRQADGTLTTEF